MCTTTVHAGVELARNLVKAEEALGSARDRVLTLEQTLQGARQHVIDLEAELEAARRAYLKGENIYVDSRSG